MRTILLTIALAVAEPATGPIRVFTGADLFNLEQASDPQISPTDRRSPMSGAPETR